jgi:hypothetical protein
MSWNGRGRKQFYSRFNSFLKDDKLKIKIKSVYTSLRKCRHFLVRVFIFKVIHNASFRGYHVDELSDLRNLTNRNKLKCKIFERHADGSEKANRRRWRRNIAGRWRRWRGGRAATDLDLLCCRVDSCWTPWNINIYLIVCNLYWIPTCAGPSRTSNIA